MSCESFGVRVRIEVVPIDKNGQDLSPNIYKEHRVTKEEFMKAAQTVRGDNKRQRTLKPTLLHEQHIIVDFLHEVFTLLVGKARRRLDMSEQSQMSDFENDDRRFIIWNTKRDGEYRYPDENSDGILGRIGLNNVYLTAYANYPDGLHPRNLGVGQCINNVKFSLSGETGIYSVYRVK